MNETDYHQHSHCGFSTARIPPNAVYNAGDGGQASCFSVLKIRQKARLADHPVGQDLFGALDLRRRSGYKNPYVKAFNENDGYTIISLRIEQQERVSG